MAGGAVAARIDPLTSATSSRRRATGPASRRRKVRGQARRRGDAGGRDVGFGYGSLAAGADILFAEALLDRGASLHVVLPFDRERICRGIGSALGRGWVGAVRRLPQRGGDGALRHRDQYLGDDHLFGYCSQLAMGLALLRGAPSVGRASSRSPSGTAAVDRAWRHRGRCRALDGAPAMRSTSIPVGDGSRPGRPPARRSVALERRTRAMLFGDIHGFSKLTDTAVAAVYRRDARHRRGGDRAEPGRHPARQYLGRRAVPGVRRRRQGGQLRARAAGGARRDRQGGGRAAGRHGVAHRATSRAGLHGARPDPAAATISSARMSAALRASSR